VLVRGVGGNVVGREHGTAQLAGMKMEGVVIAPGVGHNLISAHKLATDHGMKGTITPEKIEMSNNQGDRITAIAREGVYVVNGNGPSSDVRNSQAAIACKESSIEMAWRIHEEFNHMGHRAIFGAMRASGRTKEWQKIKKVISRMKCEVCMAGKMAKKISHDPMPKQGVPLGLVSMDLEGPRPEDRWGNKYLLNIVDSYSGYIWSIPLQKKSDVAEQLPRWRSRAESESHHTLRAVRSDNAPELKKVLDSWLLRDRVRTEYTLVNSSSQNGLAERAHRTIADDIRTMTASGPLHDDCWSWAAQTAAYVRNLGIPKWLDISCYSALTGRPSTTEHLRKWGSRVMVRIDPPLVGKVAPRSRPGYLVGYDELHQGWYKVWIPEEDRVVRSATIGFPDEESPRVRGDFVAPEQAGTQTDHNPDQPKSPETTDNDGEPSGIETPSSLSLNGDDMSHSGGEGGSSMLGGSEEDFLEGTQMMIDQGEPIIRQKRKRGDDTTMSPLAPPPMLRWNIPQLPAEAKERYLIMPGALS